MTLLLLGGFRAPRPAWSHAALNIASRRGSGKMPQTRPGSAARLNSIKPRQLLGQAGRDHLSALQSDLADEGAYVGTNAFI